jgi:hypothetical protein
MKNLEAKLRRHASQVLDPGYPYYRTPELVREAADEIARLRLTDAEREAIAACIADDEAATAHERADTLRGLLTRTK